MKHLALGILVLFSAFAACDRSDDCSPESTRCSGNVAQICDADRNWQVFADCDSVSADTGEPFVCAYIDEETTEGRVTGHTCVLVQDGGSHE